MLEFGQRKSVMAEESWSMLMLCCSEDEARGAFDEVKRHAVWKHSVHRP
jgi:hypothetical protein